MRIKQPVIFLSALLFTAVLFVFPPQVFSKEQRTIEGMVQIERNHLYMIPLGSKNGIVKGDIIDIYRLDVKVAEARLISVLPDSSMAEIMVFINVSNVFESDTVRYFPRDDADFIQKTLSTDGLQERQKSTEPDLSEKRRGEEKRGLLGSDTSVGRQVYLAKEPLKKEIEGLKAGMYVLEDDYKGKMDVVMSTVAGAEARPALAVEKKWRKKFVQTNKEHQKELEKQKRSLEDEFSLEKEEMERRIIALTRQINDAGEKSDIRTKQLLKDLQGTDTKIDVLREAYEKERLFDEGQWRDKIAKLEKKYQAQLKIQQEDNKREAAYNTRNLKDQIEDLKNQIVMVNSNHKEHLETLQSQLKDRQNVIKVLENEKSGLENNVGQGHKQILKFKKEIVDLKDELANTKSAYDDRLIAARKPLETKIEGLNNEIALLKKDYEEKLIALAEKSNETLSITEKQNQEKVSTVAGEYQRELNGLKQTTDKQIGELQAMLAARDNAISNLEKNREQLKDHVSQNEKEIKQLVFNVNTLKSELKNVIDEREDTIKAAKQSLEEEVQRMNAEIVATVNEYEGQIKALREKTQLELLDAENEWKAQEAQLEAKISDDKSLTEFLNGEMAKLTSDVERRDQQIARYENDFMILEKELTATKKSYADEIRKLKDSFEAKIIKLNDESFAAKEAQAQQIKDIKQKAEDDLLRSEQAWQEKLASQQESYEEKIGVLTRNTGDQVNDLLAQMKELKDDHEGRLQSLKNSSKMELSSSEQQWQEQLVEKEAQHKEEVTTLTQSARDRVTALMAQIDQLQADYEGRIQSLQENSEYELSSTDEQWQLKYTSQESKYKEAIDQLARTKDDRINSLLAKIDQLTNTYEDKIRSNKASSQNTLTTTEKQWQERLAAQTQKYKEEIKALTEDSGDQVKALMAKINQMKDEHASELRSNKESSQDKLYTSEEQWRKKLADQEQKYKEEIRVLARNSDDQIKILQAKLDQLKEDSEYKLRSAEDNSQKELSATERQWQKKLDLQERNYQDEIAATIRDRDEQVNKFMRLMDELKGDYESKLQSMQLKTQQEITFSDEEWKGRLEEQARKNQELLDSLMQNKDDQIKTLMVQIDNLKGDYEGRLQALEEKSQSELSSSEVKWQEKLTAQARKHREEIDTLMQNSGDEVIALLAKIDKLKEDHEARLQSVQEESQEKINILTENSDDQVATLMAQLNSMKEDYETRLQTAREKSQMELSTAQGQWEDKLISQERKYNEEIKTLTRDSGDHVTSLRAKMDKIKEDYEARLQTAREKSKMELSTLEAQWEEKLISQEQKHNSKIKTLTRDSGGQVTNLMAKMDEMKGDYENRIQSILENSNSELSSSEEQWQERFVTQQEEHEQQIDNQRRDSEERIAKLNQQIKILEGDSDIAIGELRSQLEASEIEIGSLEKENTNLSSDLKKKTDQLAKFENNIATLNENLAEEKLSYAEKIKFAKLSLEEKIQELNDELIIVKKKHAQKIEELQQGKKGELSMTEKQWQAKLEAQQEEYQQKMEAQRRKSENKITDLNQQISLLKGDSDVAVKGLRAQLEAKETKISVLEKQNDNLSSDLQKKNDLMAKFENNIAHLNESLNEEKLSRSDKIKFAKLSLEEKIKELNNELYSVQRNHEQKIEDLKRQAKEDLIKANLQAQNALDERDVGWEEKTMQVRNQLREEVSVLNDQMRNLRESSDYRVKVLEDELEKEKLAVSNLRMETANLELDLNEKNRQLNKAQEDTEDLEKKITDETGSYDKRIQLAKDSMGAEIEMLKSELAFARENHEENLKFLRERMENDKRVSDERFQAKLSANEARWKVKWATREEEHRKALNEGTQVLENRISNNRGELRKTITELNDRLNMLKDSSDSQIADLEADLADREHQIALKESQFQERLTEAESRWAAKLSDMQRKHQDELTERKQELTEDYLVEKKELRQSVIDLTDKFRALRDNSSNRIKDLEAQLEKREYRLGLMEDQSQQGTFEIEEKWRAKLIAAEEKSARELEIQKREVESRYLASKEKQQSVIDDLTRQLNGLREQKRVDISLKDEELAAELALLEGRHQKDLTELTDKNDGIIQELNDKLTYQKRLIDSLEQEKSELEFDLRQKARGLVSTKAAIGDLKKETRMVELSQSEKLRLAKESSLAEIQQLNAQLKVVRENAAQERIDLENRWKRRLADVEKNYVEKLSAQRKSLEAEVRDLNNVIDQSTINRRGEVAEIRGEIEDNQSLIEVLSRDKLELSAELELKNREIVGLNEEIIGLKEGLESYKEMVTRSGEERPASRLPKAGGPGAGLASGEKIWYDDKGSTAQYYTVVRKAILSKFRNFDFSAYAGKEGVVKIDFELFSDGSPKTEPEFIGTKDDGLKDLLRQCFNDAAPFPPFPKNLKKESQRFALSVSFKNE